MRKATFLGLFLLAMSLIGIGYATVGIPKVTSVGATTNHQQAVSWNGKLGQLLGSQVLWIGDWSGGAHGAYEKGVHDPPPVGRD